MAAHCKKCGSEIHSTWDCQASAAKIAAYQNREGSSAVEPRPSKPLVEGSTPSPRSRPAASTQRSIPRPNGGAAVGGRDNPGPAAKSNPTPVESITVLEVRDEGQIVERQAVQEKRRGRPLSAEPKSPRAAYQRDLMRQRRDAEKICTAAGFEPTNDLIKLVMANRFDPVQLAAHLKGPPNA